MNALLAALLLAVAPSPPPLPFPAPRLLQVTERTKFDPGTVLGFDAEKAELRIQCAAGVVTFKVAADVPVLDAAGQPIGSPARLAAGQKVRVWYVVDVGARAQEISAE
jgi:phage baseplate assembly protein gpV